MTNPGYGLLRRDGADSATLCADRPGRPRRSRQRLPETTNSPCGPRSRRTYSPGPATAMPVPSAARAGIATALTGSRKRHGPSSRATLAAPTPVLTSFTIRRDVHILRTFLTLPSTTRPVAASAIATARNIAQRKAPIETWNIAGGVTTQVAETLLGMRDAAWWPLVTPVDYAAQIGALPQDGQARENAIATHGPEAQNRATLAPRVCAIGAAKTLVRRHVVGPAKFNFPPLQAGQCGPGRQRGA